MAKKKKTSRRARRARRANSGAIRKAAREAQFQLLVGEAGNYVEIGRGGYASLRVLRRRTRRHFKKADGAITPRFRIVES